MTDSNTPQLKPGAQSTEFKGKVTVQAILGLVALVNVIRKQRGLEPFIVDAETALLIAVGLEALWTVLRQMNKGLEIRAQGNNKENNS